MQHGCYSANSLESADTCCHSAQVKESLGKTAASFCQLVEKDNFPKLVFFKLHAVIPVNKLYFSVSFFSRDGENVIPLQSKQLFVTHSVA